MKRSIFASLALCAAALAPAGGQGKGAERLHALVQGLTVTPRVLLIGARPIDADEDLIAWLTHGHHVQTGFLSLTRGESQPNHTGLETGATLGAVRVQEILNARRIDGGEQYFTRAFDFGAARDTGEVFEQWNHKTLLGEVVAVVRSFRPQVIVSLSRPDTVYSDGQQRAAAIMAREVFDAAADTVRFPVRNNGIPWTPMSLYEPGTGITIDSRDYDRMLGKSYAEIAADSRAQLRSFGYAMPPWRAPRNTQWRRIATRVEESAATSMTSLFDGIDTTFARLEKNIPTITVLRAGQTTPAVPRPTVTQLPGIRAYADSARAALDVTRPQSALGYLSALAELASGARGMLRGCQHPAREAAMSVSYAPCKPEWLDLDASLDLVQRRSSEAMLAAAGVTVDVSADREFLASFDTALVTVTVTNNSDSTVRVNDVTVTGSVPVRMTETIDVAAHSSTRVYRQVVTIAYAHPPWIYKREKNFYPPVNISLDGVARPTLFVGRFSAAASAIPVNIYRLSDVSVTLTIGRVSVTTSVGDAIFRTADPQLLVRDRSLSGTPPVTLTFERALEWAQADKPLKKSVRLIARSFSDRPLTFTLKEVGPGSVRFEALPPAITLAPHEAKEIALPLRGSPVEYRFDLKLIGLYGKDTLEAGFRTAQYAYLPPVHLFRESIQSIQGVKVNIPERLTVGYVRGAGDDADVALKQLGIPAYVVNSQGLTRFDIEGLSTIVFGPDAFRVDPDLVTLVPRFMEFARKGGTVVFLSNPSLLGTSALPYPAALGRPLAEQVAREDATVTPIDSKARLLNWPNVVAPPDWSGWVDARATNVPTTVDPRWGTVIETHDPRQPENRNTILVASVGKGKVVYTSLALTQQISGAVPGAMRIFVNLLSAGMPMDAR